MGGIVFVSLGRSFGQGGSPRGALASQIDVTRSLTHPQSYVPVQIGNHVIIGEGTVCEATSIGSRVVIGKNCVIVRMPCRCCYANAHPQGAGAMIMDGVRIADNSVIPPAMVVPPLSLVAGNPASRIAELPESSIDLITRFVEGRYLKFVARS